MDCDKKLTWETLEDEIKNVVDKLECTDYYLNNWIKGEHNRTYIEIRWYRNGKCKSVKKCGYWDNNNQEYVVDQKFQKNYNIFEL
ncbi:hypothetical protein [Clostridium botulinum]|uniref:hypothetical protein n=1 Tax=Clostridium botulinum TaxID=1491 RepID=UPI001C9B43DF|nr:hypothetical protein [Clostridium botulinum]MBY6860784.1 hypothetical protein [Clostridium botulinum]MBY7043827.1 hypothetical protein [Clostridium botulinum]